MMRKITWLVMLVAALSFALTGCPKEEKAEPTPAEEEAEEEAALEEEAEEEAAAEEEAEEEAVAEEEAEEEAGGEEMAGGEEAGGEEADLPSRENYIESTVAIGCISLDTTTDASQKTEKRKEILAKYGFTDETYQKAQDKYKDDPTVKPVITSRVTPEACKADGGEVAEKKDDATKVGDPDKDKNPGVAYGNFRGAVRGGGTRGTIMLSIRPNKLTGNVKGTRDGEKWLAGISGSVRGATFSGSGSNRNTTIRVQGRISGRNATGTLTGKVNGKPATMSFTASR